MASSVEYENSFINSGPGLDIRVFMFNIYKSHVN